MRVQIPESFIVGKLVESLGDYTGIGLPYATVTVFRKRNISRVMICRNCEEFAKSARLFMMFR